MNSAGTNNSTVGVLASSHKPVIQGGSDSWQAAVLVYNSDDNSTSSNTDDVTVSLKGLAAQKGTFNKILLDFTDILDAKMMPLKKILPGPTGLYCCK